MNTLLRAIVRLGLDRRRADVLGARNGIAGLVRTAGWLESSQVTEVSRLGEIKWANYRKYARVIMSRFFWVER